MKSNEFRIGNIASYAWKTCEIASISGIKYAFGQQDVILYFHDTNKTEQHIVSSIAPVISNSEWLTRLGFRRDDNLNWWLMPEGNPYQGHYIMEMANGWAWFIDFDKEGTNTHMVGCGEYVHELQNLCFALTGWELILSHGL